MIVTITFLCFEIVLRVIVYQNFIIGRVEKLKCTIAYESYEYNRTRSLERHACTKAKWKQIRNLSLIIENRSRALIKRFCQLSRREQTAVGLGTIVDDSRTKVCPKTAVQRNLQCPRVYTGGRFFRVKCVCRRQISKQTNYHRRILHLLRMHQGVNLYFASYDHSLNDARHSDNREHSAWWRKCLFRQWLKSCTAEQRSIYTTYAQEYSWVLYFDQEIIFNIFFISLFLNVRV